MLKRFFVTVLIALLPLAAAAQMLTIEQIEQAWGSVEPQTLRFEQHHGDGSVSVGELVIESPSRLYFNYDSGLRTWVQAGSFHIQEKPDGHIDQYPLGPLSSLFRRAANLRTGVATSIGFDQGFTWVKLIDPQQRVGGYAKVFFAPSGEMVAWEIVNEMGEITVTYFIRS